MPAIWTIELLPWILGFVALGLALVLQNGLLRPLQGVFSGAPLIGGWIADRIRDTEHAIVAQIETWLQPLLIATRELFDGLLHVSGWLSKVPLEIALGTEAALHYLRHVAVPALIHLAVAPALALGHEAKALAAAAMTFATHEVKRLDALVASTAAAVYGQVQRDLAAAVRKVRGEIAAAVAVVEVPWRAFHDHVWPKAEAEIDYAYSGIIAGERAVAAELPQLPTLGVEDLRKLLDRIPWKTAAGLLAAVPLVHWLVRALAREAGLDNPECRGKVKGICGTNPRAWESLLQLALDFTVLTNICDVLPLLEEGFSVVGAPLVETLTDVSAGLCHGSVGAPDQLHPPALHLSPAEGVHLHLAA